MTDINYDPQAEVYRTEYDLDTDESLCYTLVRSVGEVTHLEPLAVEPLDESVDPDALEAFVRSLGKENGGLGSVKFELNGWLVTVRGDETIELRHRMDGNAPSNQSDENG